MVPVTKEQMSEVVSNFKFSGVLTQQEPYGSGHINDTFLLVFDIGEMGSIKVILQRMNTEVFAKPVELMENILGVTSYLRERIIESAGDPERETLNVIPALDLKPFYKDTKGDYWRAYKFISDATSYDQVERPDDFYQSAVAFGNFQKLLAGYPAESLHETIPGFHNTKKRFLTLQKAIAEDVAGRAKCVEPEIRFAMEREEVASCIGTLLKQGELPIRVTHNDTKLNNIMIDNKTRKGICVIDLDTVMPGLAMHDFGDAVRFGASTAAEDETDLNKVGCDMELFELFTKGYVEGCQGRLTEKEMQLLPMGAKVMTFECGIRFLTDYLQGDTYFKIHREHHNLDRCRTQFKLVEDMEKKWYTMLDIAKKYSK